MDQANMLAVLICIYTRNGKDSNGKIVLKDYCFFHNNSKAYFKIFVVIFGNI